MMMAKLGRPSIYPGFGIERKVYGKKIPESEFDNLKSLLDSVIEKIVNNINFRKEISSLVNKNPDEIKTKVNKTIKLTKLDKKNPIKPTKSRESVPKFRISNFGKKGPVKLTKVNKVNKNQEIKSKLIPEAEADYEEYKRNLDFFSHCQICKELLENCTCKQNKMELI